MCVVFVYTICFLYYTNLYMYVFVQKLNDAQQT